MFRAAPGGLLQSDWLAASDAHFAPQTPLFSLFLHVVRTLAIKSDRKEDVDIVVILGQAPFFRAANAWSSKRYWRRKGGGQVRSITVQWQAVGEMERDHHLHINFTLIPIDKGH